jgi:hypothetical protein
VLATLEGIQRVQRAQSGGKKVSLADLIVLGGCAAVEQAAPRGRPRGQGALHAGPHRRVPGADRRGASPCSSRRPTASATTRKTKYTVGRGAAGRPAQLLTLTAPEMTVLVGGMRSWRQHGQSQHGVFTERPGHADQRLLRQPARHGHEWKPVSGRRRGRVRGPRPQDGRRSSGPAPASTWIFGSNSQLRALAEVYGARRRPGEVRERLRRRLEQGDERLTGSTWPHDGIGETGGHQLRLECAFRLLEREKRLLHADRRQQDELRDARRARRLECREIGPIVDRPGIRWRAGARGKTGDDRIEPLFAEPVASKRGRVRHTGKANPGPAERRFEIGRSGARIPTRPRSHRTHHLGPALNQRPRRRPPDGAGRAEQQDTSRGRWRGP